MLLKQLNLTFSHDPPTNHTTDGATRTNPDAEDPLKKQNVMQVNAASRAVAGPRTLHTRYRCFPDVRIRCVDAVAHAPPSVPQPCSGSTH